jgi:hypothetical protein
LLPARHVDSPSIPQSRMSIGQIEGKVKGYGREFQGIETTGRLTVNSQ